MSVAARRKTVCCLAGVLLLWLLVPRFALAEQLPLKTYTIADGLAQDTINRIVRDSRGFLWFCTGEGLSQFDGYRFVSYTTEQGLPNRRVNDLLETRNGCYWVATGDGLCRFSPAGAHLFTVYRPNGRGGAQAIDVLTEDPSGGIWCGTHGGLYRLEESSGQVQLQFVEMGMPPESEGSVVQAIFCDQQGALWVGTLASGLYRRLPDGRVEHYTTGNGLPANRVEALLQDRAGRLWVGTSAGLAQLVRAPDPNQRAVAHVYSTEAGLASRFVGALLQSADGTIWVGSGGLSEFTSTDIRTPSAATSFGPSKSDSNSELKSSKTGRSSNGRAVKALSLSDEAGVVHFRTYTTAQGLSSSYVLALAEDRDGNLWIGTDSGGAMKLARNGFTSFTQADGLGAAGVDSVFEDRAGELCVISSGTKHFINRFDGRRFTSVWPDFPKGITNFGWGWNQVTFQDHQSEWWAPTGQGLCRFPAVTEPQQLAHLRPTAVYTAHNGLAFDDVFRLFEDSRGDIWISTLSVQDNGLTRWERATETLHTYSEADGLVSLKSQAAVSFGEDQGGNLWIGHWGGGLSRRSGGRFELFGEADGLPAGTIRDIYADHAHRLWIAGSAGGLARVDDPTAQRPRFITYTTAEGLSSNDVWCVTEDLRGHIYIGTARGLDRLDPDTGTIKHYTAADGLPRGKVTSAFRDPHGALWFCSNVHGLSRLVAGSDPPRTEAPILISGLRIGGVAYPVSQLGETNLPELSLGASQNQLNIDFVGLSFSSGDVLRYQYRLEGAEQDWSQPTDQRSVNYANLAPGRYRFQVRAVNAEGLASTTPATLSFVIPPPVWKRWWFLGLLGVLLALAVYALHRQRVARLIELERIRTRIATDLHDDIGANLSLIAMMSDVAGGQLRRDDPRMKEWFATIASTSRDTVDAMSDIVWAVNPNKDQLRDLTQRMRRFAEDICGARDIELEFRAAEPGLDLKAGADLRREVFLIFKESINNSVRHSGCTRAGVEFQVDNGWLVMETSDNGCGFEVARAREGNGFPSMRRRAEKLGGSLEMVSPNGHSGNGRGASVRLRVPLGPRSRN